MQKFKRGDLIIKDGKFYYAKVVGDNGTAFKAIGIAGFFGYNVGYGLAGTGCGGENAPRCNDWIFLSADKCCGGPSTFVKGLGKRVRDADGFYPVLGTYDDTNCGGVSLKLPALVEYYPELALEYSEIVKGKAEAAIALKAKFADMRIGQPTKEEVKAVGIVMSTTKKAVKKTTKKKR